MSRRAAGSLTMLTVASMFATVFVATDPPRLARPRTTQVAALAVRDAVPPFQQWGTRAFSLPTLQSAYAQVDYLTLPDDQSAAKHEFQTRLRALLDRRAEVDLFLLAHSNEFVAWTKDLDASQRARLRLVYNTGCFDLRQRDAWLTLGADSYVGHVGESASSVFYVYFLRSFVRGHDLATAVTSGNASTTRRLRWLGSALGFDAEATITATAAQIGGDTNLTIVGARP